jgi:hypothetical protein
MLAEMYNFLTRFNNHFHIFVHLLSVAFIVIFINSMESREGNNRSATQEIIHLLQNTKIIMFTRALHLSLY